MNYLDLFSGIGGFALGLEKAGININWTGHSEVDKHCCKIYHRHFPESECLGDIKTINPIRLPELDLITFGFPCQDLSMAGKRGGLHANRSGLFFEAMRIVKATLPKVFIFENVVGLLTSKEGKDFKIVLEEIADIGLYECEWQVVNTRWFLPQNRERIYFIGHLRGASRPKVFPIGEGNQQPNGSTEDISSAIDANYYKGKSRGFGGQGRQMIQIGHIGCNSKGQRVYDPEGIACSIDSQGGEQGAKTGLYYLSNSKGKTHQQDFVHKENGVLRTLPYGHHGNAQHYTKTLINGRIRRLTPIECERLQGSPDNFTEGISDTQRYKMLGNAVSVPVIEEIMRRLYG